jgi:subtilase family serine protease
MAQVPARVVVLCRMRTFSRGAAGAASLLLAGLAVVAPAGAAAVKLPSALPTLSQQLPSLGHASADEPVHALIGLRLRNGAALDAFIAKVSDPRSAGYARYLSPRQFRARYSPTAADVAAIRSFARANGLTVGRVPANRMYVPVSGTVAQAERAFSTRLDRFRVDGRLVRAPVRTPAVPASIAKLVVSIEGLNTGAILKPMAQTSPAAFVNAPPCSSYWGERTASGTPGVYGDPNPRPYAPCGYAPGQLQGAYGTDEALANGLDGHGQTVGIIDAYASQTIQDDAKTWSSKHGLPPVDLTDNSDAVAANFPQDPSGATFLDPEGWAGEETLDIEAVHAMAPGAKIVYEGAHSPLNSDLTTVQNDFVDNKLAQIVSNSYGGTDDTADATTHQILQQAATEGIGFYFSSGDEGDETQDPNGPGDREVDSPANDPLATAVGGTSLAVGQGDTYQFETGWGTRSAALTNGAWASQTGGDWIYGGGGGVSQTYAQPSYQAGVVPPAIASYFAGKPPEASQGSGFTPLIPGRAVPDVAMDGDPNTGMLEGITQDFSQNPGGIQTPADDVHYGEYRIGGTSLSSPLFAGVMALADQAQGKPHGYANPALYAAAGTDAYRDVVPPAQKVAVVRNDFTNGIDSSGGTTTSLRTMDQLLTLHEGPGYDDTTGLGSPHGLAFLHAMAPGSPLTLPVVASAPSTQPSSAAPAPAPASAPVVKAKAPPIHRASKAKKKKRVAKRHKAKKKAKPHARKHKAIKRRAPPRR